MAFQFSDRITGMKPSAAREILKMTADPTFIPFAAGNPAVEAFPVELITKITADLLQETPINALQYSISEGYIPLRENIHKVLLSNEDIVKENDQIQVTSGAQQAIELATKVFCNHGDTIICENPSFVGSLNTFRSYGVNLVGVDMEDDGIDLNQMEDALKNNPNTKLIYLIPNFQNPTGKTMSLAKRQAVLALAVKYDVLILEDNPYGDLRIAGEHVTSIKSMDTTNHVLYCGSFSKILAPGLRVGYLVAEASIQSKIVIAKQCSDVHTAILNQMICNRFLETCDYPAHVAHLCAVYKRKCNLMLDQLAEHLNPAITLTKPEGGLFIWGTLPDGVDMNQFCLDAIAKKVAVVPGTAFLPEGETSQSFRMNFSTPSDEAIVKGVQILGEISKQF